MTMKKLVITFVLASIFCPAFASDFAVPEVESVKSFVRPDMSRFQYNLPEGKNFNWIKKKSAENYNDIDEIVLDEEDIKPVKKVIKRINPESTPQQFNPADLKNAPMNYDNFPKFYDANNLMNQQFIPSAAF